MHAKVSSTYLNNFIPWEFQEGDIGSIAGHEIAVQDPQDTFVGNDQKIILLPLELENDRLKTDSKVVV